MLQSKHIYLSDQILYFEFLVVHQTAPSSFDSVQELEMKMHNVSLLLDMSKDILILKLYIGLSKCAQSYFHPAASSYQANRPKNKENTIFISICSYGDETFTLLIDEKT